jgi:hypothetical protein
MKSTYLFLSQKHPGSLLEGFTQTQVSTLSVKDKLLVAGGFQGELICKVSCIVFCVCVCVCILISELLYSFCVFCKYILKS